MVWLSYGRLMIKISIYMVHTGHFILAYGLLKAKTSILVKLRIKQSSRQQAAMHPLMWRWEAHIVRAQVVIEGLVGIHSSPARGHQLCYDVCHDPEQAAPVQLARNLCPLPAHAVQADGQSKTFPMHSAQALPHI